MGKYLLIDDSVDGRQGEAYIDVFGEVSPLLGITSLEITDSLKERTLKQVGTIRTQSKPSGMEGSGKMTLQYHNVSTFSKIIENFKKTGKYEKFNLTVINDDKGTSIGKRTIGVYGCSLTGDIPIGKLDANEESATIDVSFKFDSWNTIGDFSKPQNIGQE